MTMPISPAPAPTPASATASPAAADTGSADSPGANGSFGSVFDAATKSPDKAAAESSGSANTKAASKDQSDKADKHSDGADALIPAAAVAALPMLGQTVAAPRATPISDNATAVDGAASAPAIKGAAKASRPVKTPITDSNAATDPDAAGDPGAASAAGATAAARALPAAGTSKQASTSQAAKAFDMGAAHHANDTKDPATALATVSSVSALNSSPPGAASTALALHGGVQPPQPNAPVAVQHIAAPVGSPPWHDEVAQGLLHVITLHQQHAELHVNPPHMGSIDVHIHVTADQAAVTFTASHPDTRAALEQAMPRLRDMLSGQGIFLGQAAVQSDSRPRQGPPQDHRAPRRIAAAGAVAASSPIRVVHYFARSDRIVDTFA